MIDLSEDLKTALQKIKSIKKVYYQYPKSFSVLPCVTYYEINNRPKSFSDDKEYLSEIEYIVDIWAETVDENNSIAGEIDKVLNEINLVRDFSHDVFDGGEVRHKTMRYKFIG